MNTNIFENPEQWLKEFKDYSLNLDNDYCQPQGETSESPMPSWASMNNVFAALAGAMQFIRGTDYNPHNETLGRELTRIQINYHQRTGNFL